MSLKIGPDGVAESNRRTWDSDLSGITVWGEGYIRASLMLIGERPGRWEAVNGRPFSGPAGRELDYYLGHAGIVRQQLWVTNLVKTFRDYAKPDPDEIAEWIPVLRQEIANVRPRTIALLGSYALSGIMHDYWPDKKLAECHGRAWRMPDQAQLEMRDYPATILLPSCVIVPCYHPACSLYDDTGQYKLKLEYDFRMVKAAHDGRTQDLVDWDGGLGPDIEKDVVGIRAVGTQVAPGAEGTIPQEKLWLDK